MAAFAPWQDWDLSAAGQLLKQYRDYVALRIGDALLTTLNTTAKTSLVAAINEVRGTVVSEQASLDTVQASLNTLNSSANTSPAIDDGSTAGNLKTSVGASYRIDGELGYLAATDDFWDLSAETDTLAGKYRAYSLEIDDADVAQFVATTPDSDSEEDALAALAAVASTRSRLGIFVAGPECDFDDAGGLAAQGTINNGDSTGIN